MRNVVSEYERLTLQSAPPVLQQNLEVWGEIWSRRCELIEKFQEESYARHILLLLPDLVEEVEFNANHFMKDAYARAFFYCHLSEYSESKSIGSKPRAVRQSLAERVETELRFVMEALWKSDHSFELTHVLTLIKRIDSTLTTPQAFDHATDLLLGRLTEEKPVLRGDQDIVLLTDTIILMFWRNGRLPQSIKYFATDILATFDRMGEQGQFYSRYPGAPPQGQKRDLEYGSMLEAFFESLTIGERFTQLKKAFRLEPVEYELIFRVLGFELGTHGFEVGNVRVYDPRKEKHIKRAAFADYPAGVTGVEATDTPGHSLAVKMRGIDSTSMKLQARQTAERALAFLTRRKKREQPFVLSDGYSMCDMEGKEVAAAHGLKEGEYVTDSWREVTESNRQRFGNWMNQVMPVPSIQKWLSALDWHRRAVEAGQSTQELLNAWFAVEHLFDETYKISLRVPEFLKRRPITQKTQSPWLHRKDISFVQIILSLAELKFELSQHASETAGNFLPDSSLLLYSYALPSRLLSLFTGDNQETFNPEKFIEVSDEIMEDLSSHKILPAFEDVSDVRRLFFEAKLCREQMQREFWRIKDDIYNIYRIRNMLIHRATTQSKLVDYYACRAREYSFALLYHLKWKLLRTTNDSEILSLEQYFQEIVIDSNMGLEALQAGDMKKFRHWVFH